MPTLWQWFKDQIQVRLQIMCPHTVGVWGRLGSSSQVDFSLTFLPVLILVNSIFKDNLNDNSLFYLSFDESDSVQYMLTFLAFQRVCTLSEIIKQSIVLMLTAKETTHLTVQLHYCQDFLNLPYYSDTQLITNIFSINRAHKTRRSMFLSFQCIIHMLRDIIFQ